MGFRVSAVVEPGIQTEAEEREYGHPAIGEGGAAKAVHRPSQEQRREKSAEGAEATDNADRRARFPGQNLRDDFENAAIAESGGGADQGPYCLLARRHGGAVTGPERGRGGIGVPITRREQDRAAERRESQ